MTLLFGVGGSVASAKAVTRAVESRIASPFEGLKQSQSNLGRSLMQAHTSLKGEDGFEFQVVPRLQLTGEVGQSNAAFSTAGGNGGRIIIKWNCPGRPSQSLSWFLDLPKDVLPWPASAPCQDALKPVLNTFANSWKTTKR
jgi:hypothetical protein